MVALAEVEHINVWRHGDVPESLNYGTSNHCGDVIVAPDLGWQFAGKLNTNLGAHGYSPEENDMKSIFIATGPYFEKYRISTIKSIRNIDIYSLLADMLGIEPVKTDGTMPNF
jgi:alkaline phosphatase D